MREQDKERDRSELNPENLVLGSTTLITEVTGATAAWIHDQEKSMYNPAEHPQRGPDITRYFQRLGEREDMQKRLKEKKVMGADCRWGSGKILLLMEWYRKGWVQPLGWEDPAGGHGYPPIFLPGRFHRHRGSSVGYSQWDLREAGHNWRGNWARSNVQEAYPES